MKARIALTDPDAVDATVTLTMSLGRWKLLQTALQLSRYHATTEELAGVIKDLVAKASAHFEAEPPADAA